MRTRPFWCFVKKSNFVFGYRVIEGWTFDGSRKTRLRPHRCDINNAWKLLGLCRIVSTDLYFFQHCVLEPSEKSFRRKFHSSIPKEKTIQARIILGNESSYKLSRLWTKLKAYSFEIRLNCLRSLRDRDKLERGMIS